MADAHGKPLSASHAWLSAHPASLRLQCLLQFCKLGAAGLLVPESFAVISGPPARPYEQKAIFLLARWPD